MISTARFYAQVGIEYPANTKHLLRRQGRDQVRGLTSDAAHCGIGPSKNAGRQRLSPAFISAQPKADDQRRSSAPP